MNQTGRPARLRRIIEEEIQRDPSAGPSTLRKRFKDRGVKVSDTYLARVRDTYLKAHPPTANNGQSLPSKGMTEPSKPRGLADQLLAFLNAVEDVGGAEQARRLLDIWEK